MFCKRQKRILRDHGNAERVVTFSKMNLEFVKCQIWISFMYCFELSILWNTVVQPFNGKGPRPLFWVGSGVEREKLTVSGITNRLHYCVEFMLCAQFTNLAAGRRLGTHDLKAYGNNEPGGVLGIKLHNLIQMTGVTFLNEISIQSDTFLRACTCVLTFIGQTGCPRQVKYKTLWTKGKTLSPLKWK